jgi:hypothetical protein
VRFKKLPTTETARPMDLALLPPLCSLFCVVFFVYTMICGTNKFHRHGCVGWWFVVFTDRIPGFCRRCVCGHWPGTTRLAAGGCSRYFVVIFFGAIYSAFAASYLLLCFPNLPRVYPATPALHRFLSVFVLPWPWVSVAILRLVDPGEVTLANVESYLERYPYDGILYTRRLCPTLGIPAPARSRFCRYTNRRVAYFLNANSQLLRSLLPVGPRTDRGALSPLLPDVPRLDYNHRHLLRVQRGQAVLVALPRPRADDQMGRQAI